MPLVTRTPKINPNEKQIRKKLKMIIISILIFTSALGGIMILKSLAGDFNEPVSHKTPISKIYQISFNTHNVPGIDKAAAGYTWGTAMLNGNIILHTTLLSVGNPIDVEIQLEPNFLGGIHSSVIANSTSIDNTIITPNDLEDIPIDNIMTAFPETYFAIFLGAENFENRDTQNDNVAIINLTRTVEPPQISGNGKLIYEQDGEREVLVIDPRELSEYGNKILEYTKEDLFFKYTLMKNETLPNNPNDMINLGIPPPQPFSEITGGQSEYYINVKSPDELSTLSTRNFTIAAFWIALITIPLAILIPLYEKIAKHFISN